VRFVPTPFPARIGRYDIVERLGAGAMGMVYRAIDPVLNRTVAIKVLPHAADELRDRFAQEARAAASLRHPSVVTIYDVGEDEGRPFIAMECLEGETMAALISRRAALMIEPRLQLIIDLCRGLGYAHQQGLIHRDVKPANLMVTPHGLKILDFGLARLVVSTAHGALTTAGSVIGTAHYMSPEQILGTTADQLSEVFAVGLVLFELLAYRKAYPGDTSPVVMYDIVHNPPPDIREAVPRIDSELATIVSASMEKDRAKRYPSLDRLAADLERVRGRLSREAEDATFSAAEAAAPTEVTLATATVAPPSPTPTPTPTRADVTIPTLSVLAERRAAQIDQLLRTAEEHLEGGRFEAAIERGEDVLLLDTSNTRALDLLGRAQTLLDERRVAGLVLDAEGRRALGEFDEADKLIVEALSVRPSSQAALAMQRIIERERRVAEESAARRREIQEAIAEAEQLLASGELEAAVTTAAGALALQGGHLRARAIKQRALAAIEERRRREAHEAAALDTVAQARDLAATGKVDDALELLRAFAPPHPLVNEAIEVTERQQALAEAHRREEEERERRAREQEQHREQAAKWRAEARSALERGQFGESLAALERARMEWPGDPDVPAIAQVIEQAREAAAAATRTRLAATRHLAEATRAVGQGDLTSAMAAASAAFELLPADPEVLRVRALVERRAAEEARRREEEQAAHAAIERARALAKSGQLPEAIRDLESFRPLDLVESVLEELQLERLRLDEERRQDETRKADEERRLMEERRAEAERRFEERRRREQERRRETEQRVAEGPRPREARPADGPRITLKPERVEDAGSPDFGGREQTRLVAIPGGPAQWTSRRPEEYTVALDLKTLPARGQPPAAPTTTTPGHLDGDLPIRSAADAVHPSQVSPSVPRRLIVGPPRSSGFNVQVGAAAVVVSALLLGVWLTQRRIDVAPPPPQAALSGVAAAQQAYQNGNRAQAVELALNVPEGSPERIQALELLDTIRRAAEQRAEAARLDAEAAGRSQHEAFMEGLARLKEAEALDQPGETLPASTLFDAAATLFRQAAAAGAAPPASQ
jgi:serine/threonine-protein kinase